MQRQLDGCVGDGFDAGASIGAALPRALERTRHCISRVRAWSHRGFDPLNSGQYATLLYFVSRELWLSHGDAEGATRLFLLNKALNAMELFHEIELPDVFFLSHTPGLVLAKASYASHLVLHQGCTVGRKAGDARQQRAGAGRVPGRHRHAGRLPGTERAGRAADQAGAARGLARLSDRLIAESLAESIAQAPA
jgi:serine O-acetyltransferase